MLWITEKSLGPARNQTPSTWVIQPMVYNMEMDPLEGLMVFLLKIAPLR
jgi:hypothetical protein